MPPVLPAGIGHTLGHALFCKTSFTLIGFLSQNWHSSAGNHTVPQEGTNDMIRTYFIVYNTNGSDASSNNLQGLHHKTNNLYENLIYNCWMTKVTIVIWKYTNVNWYSNYFAFCK